MNVALSQLPFSQACENNKAPIAKALKEGFADRTRVLEIGSGTGQHALHLSTECAYLHWQCSDQSLENRGLIERIEESRASNLPDPLVLNVDTLGPWPGEYDAIFSANTLHIMHWSSVVNFWKGVASTLPKGGKVAIYGPFNYGGAFTSESNARFDASLKAQDPDMGIRDFSAVNALALEHDYLLFSDLKMPANNRLIIWQHKG